MPAPAPDPASGACTWQPAVCADADRVLALMRDFYREEHLTFDEAVQGVALGALLAEPASGIVFLLKKITSAQEATDTPAFGHLVLTWGYSLEFGGRFALLDELFLMPELRGRGEGRRAVEFAAAWGRAHGAQALRLEVDRENLRARDLYGKSGLTAQARDLMTLRLAPSSRPAASP